MCVCVCLVCYTIVTIHHEDLGHHSASLTRARKTTVALQTAARVYATTRDMRLGIKCLPLEFRLPANGLLPQGATRPAEACIAGRDFVAGGNAREDR